jgi:transposase, IS6 family
VRVKGRWKYLYRAIDKDGATLDFYLADRRNAKAAKRFLAAALKRSRDWMPRVINTDKNPAYGEAIAELKKEGRLPKDTQHRQVKYLNNRLKGDHGKLKRLIQPTLGFQSMKTAYATIKGFEVMRMFKVHPPLSGFSDITASAMLSAAIVTNHQQRRPSAMWPLAWPPRAVWATRLTQQRPFPSPSTAI